MLAYNKSERISDANMRLMRLDPALDKYERDPAGDFVVMSSSVVVSQRHEQTHSDRGRRVELSGAIDVVLVYNLEFLVIGVRVGNYHRTAHHHEVSCRVPVVNRDNTRQTHYSCRGTHSDRGRRVELSGAIDVVLVYNLEFLVIGVRERLDDNTDLGAWVVPIRLALTKALEKHGNRESIKRASEGSCTAVGETKLGGQ
jgi:nitrate reductase NapAB chaperone NapD